MTMNLRELLQRRANLIHQAREIIDGADADDRNLTQEEQDRYDALMEDVNDLSERIDRTQRQQAMEADLQQSRQDPILPDPDTSGDEQETRVQQWQGEQRTALNRFLRDFEQGGARIQLRALQADSDIYGGYLVTPVQFVRDLIQAVDDLTFVRQWATRHEVASAQALGAPSLDNDPADPTWTSELAIGSEDSTMSFGTRELNPHPLAKYIKVSRKLLRLVADAESLVRERLAYKFAVTEENAFLNGDGAGEPLGVFTASDLGISTSRDASTGNTDTSIMFDGLIEAKYTLKMQYWPRARWLFHRDGVKQIAKLKDGEGQYIWRESVRVGEPDRILGFPAYMSEYAPNTFTTGKYVGILGDWATGYWIADSLSMEIQRLVELYAATNQVGLIGRLECDGMPVLEEAFVRVTLT
jgi:HK97 family phage major capsid protein